MARKNGGNGGEPEQGAEQQAPEQDAQQGTVPEGEGVPAQGAVPASQADEGDTPGAGPVLRAATPEGGVGEPVNVQQEFVAPQRYTVGEPAKARLYGVRRPDGTVEATGGGGTEEPEPGTRGVVLAVPGQPITVQAARALNAEGA